MQKRTRGKGFIDLARLKAMTDGELESMAIAERRSLGMPDGMPSEGWFHVKRYPSARTVREALGLSQSEFAKRFGLSIKTVQHWEQQRTVPDRAALVLLKTIERAPDVVASAVDSMRVTPTAQVLPASGSKRG